MIPEEESTYVGSSEAYTVSALVSSFDNKLFRVTIAILYLPVLWAPNFVIFVRPNPVLWNRKWVV